MREIAVSDRCLDLTAASRASRARLVDFARNGKPESISLICPGGREGKKQSDRIRVEQIVNRNIFYQGATQHFVFDANTNLIAIIVDLAELFRRGGERERENRRRHPSRRISIDRHLWRANPPEPCEPDTVSGAEGRGYGAARELVDSHRQREAVPLINNR